jgi:MFS family permease
MSLALSLAPGTLLAGIAGGIAFPILPIAGVRLGLSLPFIGAILAANRAMRVVSSPIVGVLADRVGGRRTMLVGLFIQVIVISLYMFGIITARPGPFFLIGRLIHGPGSACVFIAAQALALQAGGARHAGRAAGTVRAAIVLGIPIGLVAGGLLSDAVGDAATFGIATVAVVLALAAAFITVPDLRANINRPPPFMESVRAMRDPRLLAIGALNFALSFSVGGMMLTTLPLLVHARHLSVLSRNEQGTSGLLMCLMVVMDALMTPLAGRLGDRWHAHARVAAVSLLILVGGLATVGSTVQVSGLTAGLVLCGLGGAGLGPSLLVMMGALVPRERRGTGVGILQLCGDLGGMFGPLVGTALLAGDASVPYLGTSVFLSCFLVPAIWLARLETASVVPATGA